MATIRALRLFGLTFGPYLGAGIRVKSVTQDLRHVVVAMKLRWYNRNWIGTHFGGSLYSMTDPFYMLMLLGEQNLGSEYRVIDKAGSIEYVALGRGEVSAEFRLTEQQIRDIVATASDGAGHDIHFSVDVVDEQGQTVAKVKKTLYVKKKPPKAKL